MVNERQNIGPPNILIMVSLRKSEEKNVLFLFIPLKLN